MTEEINAVSYCVGLSIAGSLMQQNLGEINPEALAEAIGDVFKNKELKYAPEQANSIIQTYLQRVNDEVFMKIKQESSAFLAENRSKAGVIETASGLQYEVVQEGSGAKPVDSDTVKVHYHGTLIDGTVFDSSVERNSPASFGIQQVIKGWTEALQLMSVGSKYRLYIPEDLAYGANPHPGGPIKPFMALIFDVELLEIIN